MKVYVLVFNNHIFEEWQIKSVFGDKEAAHREAERLVGGQAHLFDNFHVEAHDVQSLSH